jgi:hypothetical protein
LTDKNVDVSEQLHRISQTISEYKDLLMNHSKDMAAEVKNWNFAVGNAANQCTVEVNV